MLELYAKYPLGGKTKQLEYEFRLALPNSNAPLYGFMDRVTEDNEVIEYKTSSKDYTSQDIKTIQAEMYSYVIEQQTGKPAQVIFYVFNKNKVKKPTYIPQILAYQPDTSKFISKVGTFTQNVKKNKFKANKGKHCFYCLYRSSCKYK